MTLFHWVMLVFFVGALTGMLAMKADGLLELVLNLIGSFIAVCLASMLSDRFKERIHA